MPFDYRLLYPADAVESALPADRSLADSPIFANAGARASAYAERVSQACDAAGLDRPAVIAAARLAALRMAFRHGVLGDDPHAYHNQDHVLELLEDKLPALLRAAMLPTVEREALALFCCGHDLRQREIRRHEDEPIGANEAASLAETERLLDAFGLDDPTLRTLLRFAIVGSTFAAGHQQVGQAQGAFAHRLGAWLDSNRPGWREDATATEAEYLARMAADLDTSNVASPYIDFAQSAVALAIEMQQRAGRTLDSVDAGASCLAFLTDGQERYMFQLQRFASREGRAAFGAQRDANAARLRETSRAMRQRFAEAPPATGNEVIVAFREIASGH